MSVPFHGYYASVRLVVLVGDDVCVSFPLEASARGWRRDRTSFSARCRRFLFAWIPLSMNGVKKKREGARVLLRSNAVTCHRVPSSSSTGSIRTRNRQVSYFLQLMVGRLHITTCQFFRSVVRHVGTIPCKSSTHASSPIPFTPSFHVARGRASLPFDVPTLHLHPRGFQARLCTHVHVHSTSPLHFVRRPWTCWCGRPLASHVTFG